MGEEGGVACGEDDGQCRCGEANHEDRQDHSVEAGDQHCAQDTCEEYRDIKCNAQKRVRDVGILSAGIADEGLQLWCRTTEGNSPKDEGHDDCND